MCRCRPAEKSGERIFQHDGFFSIRPGRQDSHFNVSRFFNALDTGFGVFRQLYEISQARSTSLIRHYIFCTDDF
ncbi:MAG: hypothetical protein ACXW0Q_15720 [Methylovulum sp.]